MTRVTAPEKTPDMTELQHHAKSYAGLVALGGLVLLVWILLADGLLGLVFVYAPWIFLLTLIVLPVVRLLHAIGTWVLRNL